MLARLTEANNPKANADLPLLRDERLVYGLLETLPAAAYTCDADGLITYFNEHAVRLWGRAPKLNDAEDRFCGSFKLYSPDGSPIAHDECWMALALKTGTEFNGQEIVIERPDGDRLTVLAHANPIRDSAARLLGAVNVLVDISDRKRAEEDLRQRSTVVAESEARFRALVEATATVVWTMRADGWVEDMPGWHALTGQSPEENRGFGWLDAIHPDDRETMRKIWLSALETRTPIDGEYRLRQSDDTYRWCNVRIVPMLTDDGAVREWVGVCVDVEERKRGHEERARLAAIVESSDDAIVGKTLDGIITSWNRGAETIFGYTAAEALGKHISLIIPLERRAEEADVLARVRRGEKVDHFDTERHTKNGRRVSISLTVSPIKDWEGRVIGASKVARDVTERRLAEEALRRAKADAEEARRLADAANRTKSEFLASMSHELRTPLNAILGYAELVALGIYGPVSEGQRNAMGRLRRSGEHLLALVNDVLGFAKLEAGVVQYDIAPVPIDALLSSLEALVAPQLAARMLRYRHEGCDPSIKVQADADKVRQIVVNLLANAIKFTPAGGEITLACAIEAGRVRIDVRDTGMGIPPDKLEAIFEPFVQAERRRTHPGEGVGLGLAISRELARAMGGDITVASRLETGSTFTLTLPTAS
jgi:PAS domain S-box-containing protein